MNIRRTRLGLIPALSALVGMGMPNGGSGGALLAQAQPAGREYLYMVSASVIKLWAINTATGALTALPGNWPTGGELSQFAVAPSGRFLYATIVDNRSVDGFAVARTGALTPIAGSPFGAGNQPRALSLDPRARFVYVANIFSFNISGYSLNSTSGALSPLPGAPFRLTPPSPGGVAEDPSGRFLYVPDGDGRIQAFRIDSTSGALTEIEGSPFPGADGTPSMAFGPSGRFLYVAYANSSFPDRSALFSYAINSTSGALTALGQPINTGPRTAPRQVLSSGRFLFVANEPLYESTGGSVSVFAVDSASGALTPVPGSPFPSEPRVQHIALDLTGRFLYATSITATVPSAHDIVGQVYGHAVNPATGVLTALPGSPFLTGPGNPGALAVVRPQ